MPLNSHYSQTDIGHVFKYSHKEATSSEVRTDYGHTLRYYTNDHALILPPVSDKTRDFQVQQTLIMTLKSVLEDLKLNDNAEQKKKVILIPVGEEQKILGLFPRKHWVTVHFDPATKVATLLDSRPWFVSMFYPTKSMENMLNEGLKPYFDDIQIKKVYQGVQHNDIYCGAWTTTNIRDLANGRSVNDQKTAYSSNDEVNIVNENIELVGSNEPRLPVSTSFYQKMLNFLGLAKPSQSTLSTNTHSQEKRNPSSHTTISKLMTELPRSSTEVAQQPVAESMEKEPDFDKSSIPHVDDTPGIPDEDGFEEIEIPPKNNDAPPSFSL